MPYTLILTALLAAPSFAEQNKFEIDKGGGTWAFDVRWADADSERHRAQFELPAAEVKADLDEPLRFQTADANQYIVREVRRWARDRKGPDISVSAQGGAVHISASGKSRDKIKEALAEAAEVRDQATQEYLADHGFTMIDGAVVPDHLRHVQDYADDLAPLVQALGGPGDDPAAFADLALGYVQSIPYEKRSLQRDRYRRPLSLIGRNRGDCDSKSALFLALVHQAWPELPVAMVYIKGHAFVGLGLEPEDGQDTLKHEDRSWVLAEPVGPAMRHIGDVPGKHRRKAKRRSAEIRVLE